MMDFREYFDDWYYPVETKPTKNNIIIPKPIKLFEPSNLLYKNELKLVVPDNVTDDKNINKILKMNLITSGNITAIKINPKSQLRRIKLNQNGKMDHFNECVNFRFKSIAIGNNVVVKYDIVQLKNSKHCQVITSLNII